MADYTCGCCANDYKAWKPGDPGHPVNLCYSHHDKYMEYCEEQQILAAEQKNKDGDGI
jgi:hypothetical protein